MTTKPFAFLPALYAEASHLCAETTHKFAHGMWEHMVIACVLEKLSHAAGMEEAHLLGVATEYLVPLGLVSSIGYAGLRIIQKVRLKDYDEEPS